MPPDSEAPIPAVTKLLVSLLLTSLAGLLLAVVLVTAVTWVVARRAAHPGRWRTLLMGPDVEEPRARRFLRIAFGVLWIIDGLLQAQPAMPRAFGNDTLSTGLAASPGWLADLISPLARVWTFHPVVADVVTVWVQVGIGVLLLVGGAGLLSRVVLFTSLGWSLLVWVAGEFLGGLIAPGAGWLTGAPGAVLVYAMAALLLAAPFDWWRSGRAARLVRAMAGGWILVGAALQALPWEGFWTPAGLSDPFAQGAQMAQPQLFSWPLAQLARATAAHPGLANAALIVVLVLVGSGLVIGSGRWPVWAGIAVCGATWWLAQDFGVLGGQATDPNTALPLGLLVATALPWAPRSRPAPVPESDRPPHPRSLRQPALTALGTAGVGAMIAVPLFLVASLLGPADSAAIAADSGGGVLQIPSRPAPDFALTDQTGAPVSLAQLRGKLVLFTFLDPVCSDDCPVIANQLAVADRALGPLADRVAIVAIDTNPVFHEVRDVAAFTTSHGLGDLANWQFLAGSTKDLQDLTASFGIVVQVPTVGMIEHSDGIYFVGADGKEIAYLGDGADEDLTGGYAATVEREIRTLLGGAA